MWFEGTLMMRAGPIFKRSRNGWPNMTQTFRNCHTWSWRFGRQLDLDMFIFRGALWLSILMNLKRKLLLTSQNIIAQRWRRSRWYRDIPPLIQGQVINVFEFLTTGNQKQQTSEVTPRRFAFFQKQNLDNMKYRIIFTVSHVSNCPIHAWFKKHTSFNPPPQTLDHRH